MNTRYMIDTSVWIDYFRDRDKELNDFIDRLIDLDSIYINGIITSEILIGTKTKKEYDLLQRELQCFRTLELNAYTFDAVAETGYQLRREGVTVPLGDLIIALQCSVNDLTLIQKDKHFLKIKACLEKSGKSLQCS
ncbi:MAG: PIN domain-containing protein [bacterium]|nr:PIN domain-containing protein [bacterium]